MSRSTIIVNRPPLGTIIAMRLKELNKTQRWLADNAKISQVYLCNILSGRATPTLKSLRKLAQSLDMDVKDLANALLSDN